ncbi:glycosyltransferase family 2 protein [Arcobacter peruensis]|uniref:glycosyltransferase family 2 protein n=1 Tax=Arcobacter peruensis TaxID=2320140 RepID=UPI000F07D4A0|nr:glycosyltransferase family 2 protein [Arcobacter peruensis]
MTTNPLVSIAMATYNGEKYLKKQLDSILNQSYKNIEIIICDDLSTDNTVKIIKEYMKKNSFIKLTINNKNLGYAKNFEQAISHCNGEFIALCDQDDIWNLNKIDLQLNAALSLSNEFQNFPIMIHSDLEMIDDNDKIINYSYFDFRKYKLKKEKDLGHILGPCGVMGNTLFFNKKLKEKILPFPVDIENHDYWISTINELFGKRVTLDEKLTKYRIHFSNCSNSINKINKSNKTILLIKQILKREFYLPYMKTKRIKVIEHIKLNYKLDTKDLLILDKFTEYLSPETSKLKKIYNALKYSFFKRDILYRIIFSLGILIRK